MLQTRVLLLKSIDENEPELVITDHQPQRRYTIAAHLDSDHSYQFELNEEDRVAVIRALGGQPA